MDVSEKMGTPKSSILTGFSIINHPFLGTSIFGNIHIGKPLKTKNSGLNLQLEFKKGEFSPMAGWLCGRPKERFGPTCCSQVVVGILGIVRLVEIIRMLEKCFRLFLSIWVQYMSQFAMQG